LSGQRTRGRVVAAAARALTVGEAAEARGLALSASSTCGVGLAAELGLAQAPRVREHEDTQQHRSHQNPPLQVMSPPPSLGTIARPGVSRRLSRSAYRSTPAVTSATPAPASTTV